MLKIGFDLDNTIVNCFETFQNVSIDKLNDENIGKFNNRDELRNYIRYRYEDRIWTEIQAEVYGPKYIFSKPYRTAISTLKNFSKNTNFNLYIVSHKSKFDSARKGYKLQNYANKWIEEFIIKQGVKITKSRIFLCETKKQKIEKIIKLQLDCFVDDLEEIYNRIAYKVEMPILFCDFEQKNPVNFNIARTWKDIEKKIYEFSSIN